MPTRGGNARPSSPTCCRQHRVMAHNAAALLHLVIALRADFYGQCAGYPGLRRALETSQHYIGPMDAAELRRCIEGPLEVGGWEVEPGLVDLLVRDAGSEPGALPLLSHALLETWRARSERRLTLEGYAATSGVHGAIARTVDAVYGQFDSEEQAVARRIFLRLTAFGDGMQETRRRVTQDELLRDSNDQQLVEYVLHSLAAARLVTLGSGPLGNDQVELAHEALIREWPLLLEWLAEDREGLRLHRRLTEAAQSWKASDHDTSELYRGVRLVRALEWAQTHPGDLNLLERSFLNASSDVAEGEVRECEAQRERELEAAQKLARAEGARADEQRRSATQLQRIAVILAIVLALALALGGVAVMFGSRAREAGQIARDEGILAKSRGLASEAMADAASNSELGLLLALEAADVARSAGLAIPAAAESALHRALQASRMRAAIASEAGVAVSADTVLVAAADLDGIIRIWPLAAWSARGEPAGEPLAALSGSPGRHTLAFSQSHALLADATGSGNITLWEVPAGKPKVVLKGHEEEISRLVFASGGSRLASLGADGTARLWDTETGKELFRLGQRDQEIVAMDLSSDGAMLALSYDSGATEVWDTATRGKIAARVFEHHLTGVRRLRFCGPSDLIVQSAGSITLWQAGTGEKLQDFRGASGLPLMTFACSPAGDWLVGGSGSTGIMMWEVGAELDPDLISTPRSMRGLEFSDNGSLFIAYLADGSAQVWEAAAR